ncbi:hypothetical protein H5410_026744 [Solanum commersonii]|uniref:Uncharacterized protein n=1 Tax=Solanum commersonii TaxID=4109 RepID=A0A9J5Z1I5_SOLCO|nr:hypothetical protein H5410_026744 [Solanum commersonii]
MNSEKHKISFHQCLLKCINKISLVEVEFIWNLLTKEDSNMNLSVKKDSSIKTNKNNVGRNRKGR